MQGVFAILVCSSMVLCGEDVVVCVVNVDSQPPLFPGEICARFFRFILRRRVRKAA